MDHPVLSSKRYEQWGRGGEDRQTVRWIGLLPLYSFTAKLLDPSTDLTNVTDNGEEVADTMNAIKCE